MRKKMHKRINPKNPVYDKFYVINYLELGKNWEAVLSEEGFLDLNFSFVYIIFSILMFDVQK